MSIIFNFNQRKGIKGVTYPVEQERVYIGNVDSDIKTEYLVPTIRLTQDKHKRNTKFRNAILNAKDFINVIKTFYENYPDLKGKIFMQEVFGAIYVDRQNKPLGITYFGMGSVSGVVVDPKLVMTAAVLTNATGMCAFHNHPSGAMKFSPEDKKLSKKIAQSCAAMDIQYLDFLVISPFGYDQEPFPYQNYLSAQESEIEIMRP